jgi:hypothetical protein
VGKGKIFKRPEENSQCRLLFGGLLHPPGPSRNTCCWRQGLVGRLRGPRHGNSHCSDGGWACFHPFGIGPGWQSRETTSGYCQYSAPLILSSSPKQQLSTWSTRLLAPCVCTLVVGPSAPMVERRPTPRSGRRSCPGAVLLQLLLPPASPRMRWTRCCLELQQGEPSWPQWQQGAVLLQLLLPPASPHIRRTRCYLELQQGEPSWLQWQQKGGDDTLGGGRVAAGSCSTAPCVPVEDSPVT